ncbi:putative membrane protein [Kroppenstedtia sanguinis]|uniref:Uncharacterized protein n=1 Tax=Kroppenstedtia sanguinis TaxID=1380684 RepID=A0ABW4C6F1_9BACL
MTGNRREQLRQMIREIVQEELARIGATPPDEKKKKAKAPQKPARPKDPQPVPGKRETTPPPPWALFGSPQPAPDGKKKTPDSHSHPQQFHPLEPTPHPPPFISGNWMPD